MTNNTCYLLLQPNIQEVKDILKNADFHFVDVLESKPTSPSPPHHSVFSSYQHHEPKPAYQPPHHIHQPPSGIADNRYPVSHGFPPNQPQITPFFAHEVKNPGRPYAELYDHRFQVSKYVSG